ncbi:MAG: carboxypeptidase-like regulatory domain-containing protein [Coriobacteriia bacterium]|nr:carboxypeptidase-like regulatory domain-containing protein [Coriobacteriia bacterium]
MEKLEKYPLIFDKGSEPTPPEPITSFKVKGIIKDVDGNPIPNATVGFYNAEMDADLEEPMVSALTDENGYFVLEGCSTGTKDPESGLKITYAAKHYGMDEFSFNYKDIIGGEVTLTNIPELDSALVDLYSDSPQHKSFTITEVRQEKGKEPEIRYCRNLEYYGISELSSNGIDNPVFNISDNGVLVNVYTDEEETTTTTIAPNGQDGYIFDNYVINDKATYRVGDSVDISQPIQEDHYVKISTNYTVDTSKIAKTSDANIYVVAGLLAIVAAAGTLLVLRRRKQDF